jgi:uncharacterized membrane protein
MKTNRLKNVLPLLLLLFAAAPLFAQDTGIMPQGMTNLADSILEIFTGGIMRTILICCLCGCAIAYGFNKDNEKMKRNAIAIGIATGVLIASGGIVDAIMNAARN